MRRGQIYKFTSQSSRLQLFCFSLSCTLDLNTANTSSPCVPFSVLLYICCVLFSPSLCCEGSLVPLDCPPNSYTRSPASSLCFCNAGYTGQAKSCTECVMGKFKTAAGSNDCTDCEAGKYCDTTGTTAPTSCPPATTVPVGSVNRLIASATLASRAPTAARVWSAHQENSRQLQETHSAPRRPLRRLTRLKLSKARAQCHHPLDPHRPLHNKGPPGKRTRCMATGLPTMMMMRRTKLKGM